MHHEYGIAIGYWHTGACGHIAALRLPYMASLRRQMIRLATVQLSDAHLAAGAVQQVLICALKCLGNCWFVEGE
ncbi:MAG: hypothetical protein ACI83P_000420 [Janthinobacterium sp.]|jgi:hypothetical protein